MTDGLTISRRHAAGAPSARGLLFTVLGEFVLPNGGTAWTSALIDAIARLGVEEKNVRQALMRTAADGWLASERVGRRTRWRLTAAAEEMLTEGTERIYGFTGTASGWDGQWLLALARVPETDRPARHRLRTRMTWAGFGSPEPGVWISPHTSRVAEARKILAEVDARVFVARQVEGYDDVSMARQAWDLDDLEDGYETFAADFSDKSEKDAIADLTGLVHAWRRFPWVDPVLPAELLPQPWRGTQAAELFHRRHDEWSAAAQTAWATINV
ncbi:PaaX family transcriptional regulator C-terminal domain-containing protein [Actinoplanes sp. NPDC051411]|uniref:PaaX family transcriptional regulator n=1 Tax=Actinoplanes sp. NPDC051411 TaxID=3155522 RepID=UPI0034346154